VLLYLLPRHGEASTTKTNRSEIQEMDVEPGPGQTGGIVPTTTFDRGFWEERWSRVLREHADQVAHRPANARLSAAVANLRPGLALDAGCGHGSDTLWLAARGWQVTAVDFSTTALAHARSTAEARPWGRISPGALSGSRAI
jgi:SAM-dependent methyltransferase